MTKFSRFILAASAALATFSAAPVYASGGFFGAGVILSTGTNGPVLYEFTQTTPNSFAPLGDSRYTPASGGGNTLGTPSFDTSGGFSAGTENLGTFDPTLGQALYFDGGEGLTFKNSGTDVTGVNIYYAINNLNFSTADALIFNQDNVNGTTGDQRWYNDSAHINLLTGLANGTYTLNVYLDSPTTSPTGTNYANNSGSPTNYKASFTVVPEPSTLVMMLSSSLFGTFYLLSRKRH